MGPLIKLIILEQNIRWGKDIGDATSAECLAAAEKIIIMNPKKHLK